MTAAEQLTVWRAEIAAELEQLQTELATARGELAEAERQVGRLKDAQSDLEATCRRGLGNSSPAKPSPYGGDCGTLGAR